MEKRKWKRWALLAMPTELAEIARKKGMEVICGFTYPLCVHTQIGLYGTSEQMQATEKRWTKKGYEFTNRKPSYAFSINVDKPRTDWVDAPQALRPKIKP